MVKPSSVIPALPNRRNSTAKIEKKLTQIKKTEMRIFRLKSFFLVLGFFIILQG